MPQMAPISWISLFLIFSITFIFYNMMNYYSFTSFTPKSNLMNKIYSTKSLNWKW